MTVRKTVGTVGTLAHEAVATAVSVARHPIGSTALAAGLVKGAAGAGIDLLRGTVTGTSPTPSSDTPLDEVPAQRLDTEDEAVRLAVESATEREAEVARRLAAIREIQAQVAALPVLDPRAPDEIIGYGGNGLPA